MGTPAAAELTTETASYQRLRRLLDELFQFDQADLDFGIYRIMNQKRAEIVRFLDDDLLPQVRATLAEYHAGEQEALQADLDKLRTSLQSAGVPPESAPRYRELQDRLDSASANLDLENEVYSDLYTFFRRYYKEGDFLSLRRYKTGVYAIPYEGEEVKLHWANADQYYVKTTEAFQDYRFRLPDGRHAHLRLVAAETERDNNKATEKERRFVLYEAESVAEVDGELHIRFEYRPNDAKQRDLNSQAVETLLALPALRVWREALATSQPTTNNGSRTLLAKHLADYTAKNTFDYFIHKDLGGFLRRELDFFLKNEVAHLDDLDTADERRADQYLARLRAIKRIGHKIIDFLAQLEGFQKRLFLKKKFVIASEYCLTLNHVPVALHDQVVANEAQWAEWERLFTVSELANASDRATVLRSNPYLLVDTRFFDASFKRTLLDSIEDIDTKIDGLLINSENFQALSLLHRYMAGRIPSVYVDPPYNTNASEILYKNNYKHSSWLSLMSDRLDLARSLLAPDAVVCVTIDDDEFHGLWFVLEHHFGRERHLGTALIRNNPQGRSTVKGFAINHEYALFFAAGDEARSVGRLERSDAQIARYNEIDENGERFLWENFRKTGTDSNHRDRPKQFYPLFYDGSNLRVPQMTWNTETREWKVLESPKLDEQVFWPNNEAKVEKVWKWGYDRVELYPHHLKVDAGEGGTLQVFRRNYLNTRGALPGTWWDKAKYSAGEYGTNLLTDLFGRGHQFPFPKSVHAVEDCIRVANDEPLGIVLDFFAGSGTTAHAVINLNRAGSDYKYVLVEMGDYFETILKPRILKAVYSKDWQDGKPVSREGTSHFLKYLSLETYEDALNNLRLRERPAAQQRLIERSSAAREDYLLSYCLDAETDGSPSLLDLERFETPFDYRLTVTQGGESRSVTVDLPETFNYLLGLRVQRVRTHDGFYTVEGIDPDDNRVLVIWRSLKDPETDNEALERFFTAQGYRDRPADETFNRVYVNGDCTLLYLRSEGASWKLLLIEEEFGRLMFAGNSEGGL